MDRFSGLRTAVDTLFFGLKTAVGPHSSLRTAMDPFFRPENKTAVGPLSGLRIAMEPFLRTTVGLLSSLRIAEQSKTSLVLLIFNIRV